MKHLLTFLLALATHFSFCEGDPNKLPNFNNNKSLLLKSNEHKINLKLNYLRVDVDYKSSGACLLLSGIAFTAAALLEGNGNYGTYVNGSTPYTTTYVTQPFYRQQPRFTMFLVGCGLSIGGFSLIVGK
jgi:hypothetical protein